MAQMTDILGTTAKFANITQVSTFPTGDKIILGTLASGAWGIAVKARNYGYAVLWTRETEGDARQVANQAWTATKAQNGNVTYGGPGYPRR